MDEQVDLTNEEMPSRVEWRIEQEKLKLERERIALERERLEAMRERVKVEQEGRTAVRLSSVVLSSIICLLVGGILGAFSMSVRQEQVRTQRVRDLAQSLGSGAEVVEETVVALAPPPTQTGESDEAPPPAKPLQVKTIRPQGSGSGISLIVVQ
jgi:hypothetical protein